MGGVMDTRFTDNGDGTVLDTKTGLIWTEDARLYRRMAWSTAINVCKSLGGGWRLPERFELEGLLDLARHDPALPQGHPFTNVQSAYYWSATTYVNRTDYAWCVYMLNGNVHSDYKAHGSYYVWPVKEG